MHLRFKTIHRMVMYQYEEIWEFLNSNRGLLGLSLLFLAEAVIYHAFHAPADQHYETYVNRTLGLYPNMVTFIFFENLKSATRIIAAGLVPAFLGFVFSVIMTLEGLVITFKFLLLDFSACTIMLCVLPHGVFELTALVVSFILSGILSKEITCAFFLCWSGKVSTILGTQSNLWGVRRTIKVIINCWLLIIIPLILTGALIESSLSKIITDWLI